MQSDMRRYSCSVCGYVYDPVVGEPKQDVGVGVPWTHVKDDFHCPTCGQGKSAFEPICTEEYPGKSGI